MPKREATLVKTGARVWLSRILLYVQDVARLEAFYRETFGLTVVEAIPGEWSVLSAGSCELALHRVGPAYRLPGAMAQSNAKIVFAVDGDLGDLRAALLARGVDLGEIKAYPPLTGRLCDGRDPEGNVFQLAEVPTTIGWDADTAGRGRGSSNARSV